MQIEYLKAKNFLSVGNDPLEINFNKLGNIVLVEGQNIDFHNDLSNEEIIDTYHSNGAGKSAISEALVYGLYGSAIRKKVNHTDVINNVNKKKLEVEVVFKLGDTRYRILRTRKPDGIRLWQGGPPWIDAPDEDANEITLGGQPATQKHIEELLGMNHKAFVNVVCYGQHNDYNFLECTPAEQRQIAESLLSLEEFKSYCAQAKEDAKGIKSDIKEKMAVYTQIVNSEKATKERIEQIKNKQEEWEKNCQNYIQSAKNKLKDTEEQLANTDIGPALQKYEESQVKLSELKELLPLRQKSEQELSIAFDKAKERHDLVREEVHKTNLSLQSAKQELLDYKKQKKKEEEEIEKLHKLPQGAKCPHCFGVIDKKHYSDIIKLHQNKLEGLSPKIKVVNAKIENLSNQLNNHNESIKKLTELKSIAQHKLSKLADNIESIKKESNELSNIPKPDLNPKELVLKEKISQIEKSIKDKQDELENGGPYLEILNSTVCDLEETLKQKQDQKEKIDELDSLLPYYSWWSKGFDDIRSFVIERIIPSLNARIATWMQYLLNGKIEVTFNEKLDAEIKTKDGDKFAYFATCGGERRRINLAISQAFSYVMTLSSGTWPSVVFLDEVSDSIDQRGIRNVYNMICELSSEKQVFVITHNADLKQMLEGVDTIKLLRKGGFTKKIN